MKEVPVVLLPAAKPAGHRKVRIVAVVGVADYFEVMTL